MSNYYAKAINPKTKVEEDCVVLDMGKDNFVQFNNGMIYKAGEISEQEAINQDGEEIMEQWDSIYNLNPDAYDKNSRTQEAFEDEGYPNFFDYAFNWKWKLLFWVLSIGLVTSPLVVGYLLVVYFFKW